MNTYSKQTKGFTLVELLVVIAIIAALSALATPVVMKALVKAKIATAKSRDLMRIDSAGARLVR